MQMSSKNYKHGRIQGTVDHRIWNLFQRRKDAPRSDCAGDREYPGQVNWCFFEESQDQFLIHFRCIGAQFCSKVAPPRSIVTRWSFVFALFLLGVTIFMLDFIQQCFTFLYACVRRICLVNWFRPPALTDRLSAGLYNSAWYQDSNAPATETGKLRFHRLKSIVSNVMLENGCIFTFFIRIPLSMTKNNIDTSSCKIAKWCVYCFI